VGDRLKFLYLASTFEEIDITPLEKVIPNKLILFVCALKIWSRDNTGVEGKIDILPVFDALVTFVYLKAYMNNVKGILTKTDRLYISGMWVF